MPLPIEQTTVREGIDLSVYRDRPLNGGDGGILHGWGPLADEGVAHVDMILVVIPWHGTDLPGDEADWTRVEADMAAVKALRKLVYLYPHVAWPPPHLGLEVMDPHHGWIDYSDPTAHAAKLKWCEKIARRFGRDEAVRTIRMPAFEHGEAWLTDEIARRLIERAGGQHLGDEATLELSDQLIGETYEAFLRQSDPSRLIAHGGGLGDRPQRRAVEAGTGHANGTHVLDFAGRHQFPRPADAELSDGHARIKTLAQRGNGGVYCCEMHSGSQWQQTTAARLRWQTATLASIIVNGTNFVMLPPALLNGQPFRHASSERGNVSPDWTGRPTRRNEESFTHWMPSPDDGTLVRWARSLMATTSADTPEAFAQLSTHHLPGGKQVLALEHAMTFRDDLSPSHPTDEFDMGGGAEFQQNVFEYVPAHFARRTARRRDGGKLVFELSTEFSSRIGTTGEVFEVRVAFLDEGHGGLLVKTTLDDASHTLGRVTFENTGLWRTACFVAVAPEDWPTSDGTSPLLEVVGTAEQGIVVCLIRVMLL